MLALFAASAFGAVNAHTSSASCPAVFNDTLPAATEAHLQGAHQMAVLARKLQETEHLLQLSHSHPPNSGFRYGTFLCGMLVAVLLMGTAALLSWEYLRKQLQRKQQVAVVGGLKDMDDKTLKKVLGSVDLPSWVNFPDYERVGWVNSIISQLWPHVSMAATGLVGDQLNPQLAMNKPKWISDIHLHNFNLGDEPPSISGVKVYKAEDVSGEVIIELDVTWAGEQNVQLIIKPFPKFHLGVGLGVGRLISNFLTMRVGVGNLFFSGRVRLSLKPLMGRIPVVGAVRVSFVEQPHFNYALTVYGGDISFLPGLEVFINSFIRDIGLKPFVLPEGLTVPLTPGRVDGLVVPAGMVYVRLIEATHVPRLDWYTRPSPYVNLFVRDKRPRASKVTQGSHPKWEQDFELLVHEPEHQQLTAVLLEHHALDKDDEVGRVSIPIDQLAVGEMQDMWLDLGPPGTDEQSSLLSLSAVRHGVRNISNVAETAATLGFAPKHKQCQIHLQVTFHKVVEAEVEAASRGASADEVAQLTGQPENARLVTLLKGGALSVTINKGTAKQRPGTAATSSQPDLANQVKVRIGDEEKGTAAAEGQEEPGWSEVLEFAISGDMASNEDEEIVVRVWDHHWVNDIPGTLTWGSAVIAPDHHALPREGLVRIKLQDVIAQKSIKDVWRVGADADPDSHHFVDMELQWLGILDAA